MMRKSKVGIIGAGFVGSTVAYTLLTSGLFTEIVMIDVNRDKLEGDVMDLSHGVSFVPPCKVIAGEYSDLVDSEIVIITAGVGQKPGESRIDLLKRNAAIFKGIVSEVMRYISDETILLIVSNPVDILTYITYKLSGLPKNRVIGSGTVLDTSRFKYLIGEHISVDARNVHAFVVGEHGDSEVAAWSVTNVSGIPYAEFCLKCDHYNTELCDKKVIEHDVKNAAYDIIQKKGATYYAVALAVRRIVEAIVRDENSILTVSSVLEGQYGISDIALSVPTVVNRRGIDRVLQVTFSPEELAGLQKSGETLKQMAQQLGF
ncbi:MAG: L-lactate dehydrogenase [Hyphomonadaceae bacterium]|nr:L-lactate dehydrogenase [Clostridia bacterium]